MPGTTSTALSSFSHVQHHEIDAAKGKDWSAMRPSQGARPQPASSKLLGSPIRAYNCEKRPSNFAQWSNWMWRKISQGRPQMLTWICLRQLTFLLSLW